MLYRGWLGAARSFQAKFLVDSTLFCKTGEDFIKLAAVHMVDLVRYLFGEVVQVTGFANADEVNTLIIHKSESHRELPWKSLAENDTVLTPSASAMSGGYRDLYLI